MPRTKTPDYARLDDIDVYIQSIPRSPEEEKRLHDLLRKEMEKSRARDTIGLHAALTPRKRANAKATIARTKTPDYARLDDVDIYVQSTPMTPEEEKRLSELLKAHREKDARRTSLRSNLKTPKPTKPTTR